MKQSQNIAFNARRAAAKKRLEAQLESGVKPVKGMSGETIKLSSKDITRIKREIEILSQPTTKYRKKNRKYSMGGEKVISN